VRRPRPAPGRPVPGDVVRRADRDTTDTAPPGANTSSTPSSRHACPPPATAGNARGLRSARTARTPRRRHGPPRVASGDEPTGFRRRTSGPGARSLPRRCRSGDRRQQKVSGRNSTPRSHTRLTATHPSVRGVARRSTASRWRRTDRGHPQVDRTRGYRQIMPGAPARRSSRSQALSSVLGANTAGRGPTATQLYVRDVVGGPG
jgi:hypothetical protein